MPLDFNTDAQYPIPILLFVFVFLKRAERNLWISPTAWSSPRQRHAEVRFPSTAGDHGATEAGPKAVLLAEIRNYLSGRYWLKQ